MREAKEGERRSCAHRTGTAKLDRMPTTVAPPVTRYSSLVHRMHAGWQTFLYVRVFSSALPLSPSSSSPLPPTSSAPSSAVSSPTTSVRARDELRSFSVDVRHLSNWFIAKGRQRETNQKGADTAHSRKHGLQQPQPQSQKKKQKTQGETAPMTDASQAQATAEATSAV